MKISSVVALAKKASETRKGLHQTGRMYLGFRAKMSSLQFSASTTAYDINGIAKKELTSWVKAMIIVPSSVKGFSRGPQARIAYLRYS